MYRRLHNPLTRDFPGAYEMALAATFPEPLTQDEAVRWAEILPHIHVELRRHVEARAAREKAATGGR